MSIGCPRGDFVEWNGENYPVFNGIINIAATGTLRAAVANKKIVLTNAVLVVTTAISVTFKSAAGGTALTGAMALANNGGLMLPFNPFGWFETISGELLELALSSGVQTSGCFGYWLKPGI